MARNRGLSFYQKEKKIKPSMIRDLVELLIGTVIIVFLSAVIMYSFGTATIVVGNSMEPTLDNGQTILMDKFIYMVSSPKRGDVVLFYPHGNKNAHCYVKRIVALPGETVQVKDGHLYVNGIYQVEEEYMDVIADAGIAENLVTLGSSEYFVMGDNRNHSEDSRSGNIGPVDRDEIVAKGWFHMAGKRQGMGRIKSR